MVSSVSIIESSSQTLQFSESNRLLFADSLSSLTTIYSMTNHFRAKINLVKEVENLEKEETRKQRRKDLQLLLQELEEKDTEGKARVLMLLPNFLQLLRILDVDSNCSSWRESMTGYSWKRSS